MARGIESRGIPTVAISISRASSDLARPPRAVTVRWPFGHALGEPGNTAQHRTVVRDALELLRGAEGPGALRELPYRWRRHTYEDPLADSD